MKLLTIFLVCLVGTAYAQDKPQEGEKPPEGEKPAEGQPAEGEEEEPASKPPVVAKPEDPMKIISELTLANAVKDGGRIDIEAKKALSWAKTAKPEDAATIESMAKELGESVKAVKGNWGTLKTIVEALGELRSKEGAKTLKKLAFKKEAKDQQEEDVQALAIVNLGKLADPKEISAFEEISKHESKTIAKAAYTAFGSYGTSKGRIRKQCVEIMMKRLDMEYPSSGGQGGKSVSAEKQERWTEVSPAMVASMKALCREQTINDIENWREWWKDNKKNPKAEAWKDEDDKES
jgi:hypothetical protein